MKAHKKYAIFIEERILYTIFLFALHHTRRSLEFAGINFP